MRSVIRNRLDEFLEILKYDKTEWYDFWKNYRRKFGPLVIEYERLHSLTADSIEEILWSLERRSLDRLKRTWQSRKLNEKKRVSYELRKRASELGLSKRDFVVFLFGGLGISPWDVVKGLKEYVILVDILYLWERGKLENLPEIVLEAVLDFRRSFGGVEDGSREDKG